MHALMREDSNIGVLRFWQTNAAKSLGLGFQFFEYLGSGDVFFFLLDLFLDLFELKWLFEYKIR